MSPRQKGIIFREIVDRKLSEVMGAALDLKKLQLFEGRADVLLRGNDFSLDR